jgi:hypothetical protein
MDLESRIFPNNVELKEKFTYKEQSVKNVPDLVRSIAKVDL